MCGASDQQKQIGQEQQSQFQAMVSQAQQVFGNSSSVFNDLVSAMQPVVAAGANQEGFSPAEKSNLDSQAITQTGQNFIAPEISLPQLGQLRWGFVSMDLTVLGQQSEPETTPGSSDCCKIAPHGPPMANL